MWSMDFRIFLMQIGGIHPHTVKFRLLNKNIDKDYTFLGFYSMLRYTTKYDTKNDIYIMKGYHPD